VAPPPPPPICAAAPPGSRAKFEDGGNQWVRRMVRVAADVAAGKTDDKTALAAGTFSDEVTAEEMAASDELGRTRAASVKAAMQHAWQGYKDRAWGADELKPRSGACDQGMNSPSHTSPPPFRCRHAAGQLGRRWNDAGRLAGHAVADGHEQRVRGGAGVGGPLPVL